MKSKTAFLYGPGDLRIDEVEVPQLKPDQVLIQTGACGICGSDVECFEGLSQEGRYDLGPYTPGHEWGGKIIEVGNQVKHLFVPQADFVDRVFKADVKDVITPKQSVKRQLNQKSRFTDPGPGQHRPELPGVQNVIIFMSHNP